MTNANHTPIPASPSYELIRKKRLLEKIPFSKSTLHAKMTKGPYQDKTFPLPIYFPNSRIPYWREDAIDIWIASAERRSFQGREASGELGRNTAPVSSTLTAPHSKPTNQPAQTVTPSRDAVLPVNSIGGRPRQVRIEVRRKRVAMPITTAPAAPNPPEKRTQEVPASLQLPEFWTYTHGMEKPQPVQSKPLLLMPNEVTPMYAGCVGNAHAEQFASQRPAAPHMFLTGRI